MKSPRPHRPRLLMPLIFGVLLAPAYLTTSAVPPADDDMQASGVMCKNVVTPKRKIEPPRTAPNCVNCRAPLIDAPLASAGHRRPASAAELPPTA